MVTREQAQRLKLKDDEETLLLIENAIVWINNNTKISVNADEIERAQPTVRFFISKYIEIMCLPFGVSSESAGGLSQSFNSTDTSELLERAAKAIFGEDNVTFGKVSFVEARRRKW